MTRAQRTGRLVAAATVAVLTACTEQEPLVTEPPPPIPPETELWAHGMLLQQGTDAPVLCVGGVMESYPPQCGGPEVVGLDWADVAEHEDAFDVRWGEAYVVGTFDGRRFTLTRPPSTTVPTGVPTPAPEPEPDFPQLCDDPFRGGSQEAGEDLDAQAALQARLTDYPGYVASWVSNGRNLFNVTVTGDPEQAWSDFREVWRGGLCVAQRDSPPQKDVLAAQEAVTGIADEVGVLGAAGTRTGLLEVDVLLADQATVTAVHRAVAPWLSPKQVEVTGALQPVPG